MIYTVLNIWEINEDDKNMWPYLAELIGLGRVLGGSGGSVVLLKMKNWRSAEGDVQVSEVLDSLQADMSSGNLQCHMWLDNSYPEGKQKFESN